MSAIDPITLAVIQAALGQVCNEMDIAFSRAAFSPVIAEADDRSSGIYDKATGALISQGELGLPVFVGTMQYSTAELIRLIGEGKAGAPEPGDIYIVNNDSEPGMYVFSRTATGNVSPDRGLVTPYGGFGMTVDEERGEMFMTVQQKAAQSQIRRGPQEPVSNV